MLHQFVPCTGEGEDRIYAEQGNVGDQLSVERGVNYIFHVSDGLTPEERLEGLNFACDDFHCAMKFLQVHTNF